MVVRVGGRELLSFKDNKSSVIIFGINLMITGSWRRIVRDCCGSKHNTTGNVQKKEKEKVRREARAEFLLAQTGDSCSLT